MFSQTLNHLCTFDGHDLTDWDATTMLIKGKKQNSKRHEETIKYIAKRQGPSLPSATIAARG